MNSNQISQKSDRSLDIDCKLESSQQKDKGSDQSNSRSTKKVQFYSHAQLMSPLEKDIVEFKDFSTPIQIAEFSQNKKHSNDQQNDDSSPMIKIQLSNIRNIAQRENEESQNGSMKSFEESHEIEVDTVLDLMGNKIYEFSLGHHNNSEENENELSPIVEDKENDIPEKYMNLNTPLKIKHSDIRSPLQDITPSMTHKKRDDPSFNTKTNKKNKTSNKTANKGLGLFEIEKWGLLTPRTMAESRLNKGKTAHLNQSKLKIERFL